MSYREQHSLGSVLGDPVVVMLIHLTQVRGRPGKGAAAHHFLQIQRDLHARCMGIPLQRKRRPRDQNQGKVSRAASYAFPATAPKLRSTRERFYLLIIDPGASSDYITVKVLV